MADKNNIDNNKIFQLVQKFFNKDNIKRSFLKNYFNINNFFNRNTFDNFYHCIPDASLYAIIIPFCLIEGKTFVLIEKRSANIKQPFELSFPGGKKEDHENSMLDVALRECEEEIGLKAKSFSKLKFCGIFANLKTVIYVFTGLINPELKKSDGRNYFLNKNSMNKNSLNKDILNKESLNKDSFREIFRNDDKYKKIKTTIKINRQEVEKVIFFPFEIILSQPYTFDINYKGHIENLPQNEALKNIIEKNYLKDGYYLPYSRKIRYWVYDNEVLWGYSADIIYSIIKENFLVNTNQNAKF